ncbi:HNH endonuclease-domain-containing protein [Lipomyces tetrasporus]|uniref:HNH endonuclease-domain-containing protein n=1 Tax=Lipomyces tetrasporus TaxID=54092 RepID=A0AAD7R0F9_9ASCO|nr:HNH endonuclease-domain-containing protein [Lipomyces tetrasporus]KAJ8104316.1 HNH endonuclease-domain-containing protein [Lipomyces tetrasporus]
MPENRSQLRNVHFYDVSRPEYPLGGLYLNPSVSARKFLRMLHIVVRTSCPYRVWSRGSDTPLIPTDEPLVPGQYDIVCDSPGGTIWLTDERCIARTYSRTVSTRRNRRFREEVRKRDGKCVITGVVNPVAFIDEWTSFEAAHIFPLSHEELFTNLNYARYVTYMSEETDTEINTCQNGLLMRSHIHKQFDSFSFSIDPDDDYKITCFRVDIDGIDGRFLDPVCRDATDDRKVVDKFLRWHFRQTVLANMKGAGEPIFEFDFPDGSDMVGEILSGPRGADRMEAELFSRLNSVYPVS